ncbi:MAG: hypothetical protein DKT66_05025 [Candidatus Melainabacteria bacterium]|nr:MAG: hypothetical protein DKT66_05025 [Candidatus Melainabacteria bacterium]
MHTFPLFVKFRKKALLAIFEKLQATLKIVFAGTERLLLSLFIAKELKFCSRIHKMTPENEPSREPFEELDEALERSAKELEILSNIYKQRGHVQEASDIENTLASLNRTQESQDY